MGFVSKQNVCYTECGQPQLWHIHRGCIEFILAVRGSENCYIDGQHYPVRAGRIFVAFGEQARRFHMSPNECLHGEPPVEEWREMAVYDDHESRDKGSDGTNELNGERAER